MVTTLLSDLQIHKGTLRGEPRIHDITPGGLLSFPNYPCTHQHTPFSFFLSSPCWMCPGRSLCRDASQIFHIKRLYITALPFPFTPQTTGTRTPLYLDPFHRENAKKILHLCPSCGWSNWEGRHCLHKYALGNLIDADDSFAIIVTNCDGSCPISLLLSVGYIIILSLHWYIRL